MRGRAAAPKGTKSCRTQGTFVCSFVRPSVHPPPQVLSGLKSALSGLKSALPGLKSSLSGLASERADFRPRKADFWPERTGFRAERANLRPVRSDTRRVRADFRPERVTFTKGTEKSFPPPQISKWCFLGPCYCRRASLTG